MPRMVRKQIYIGEGQDRALKLAARIAGVSQAEMIRKGIGRGIADVDGPRAGGDAAWRAALKVMKARIKALAGEEGKRTWTRDELHDR